MANLKIKTVLAGLACFLYSLNLAAQDYDFEALKKKYPEESQLIGLRKENVELSISKGTVKVKAENRNEYIFLTERSGYYSEKSIYYSEHFEKMDDVEAYSYVPDEKSGKYKKVFVKQFDNTKDTESGIFYDDQRKISFQFSDLKPLSAGIMSYTQYLLDPHNLGSFMFGNYYPVLNAELSVSFPENIKVKYFSYGDMSAVSFTETKAKGKTTYTWKASNLAKFDPEGSAPNIRYYAPQVFIYIEEYTVKGETTKVLSDVKQLYKWYMNHVEGLNTDLSQELQKTTDSLCQGKSDEDKVKSVFYWVQENIKYIAFEDGLGGFVPRQASDVCAKRYGDCKDMASIISAMLNYAKVPTYLCWIGTRDIPYKYAQVPLPYVDNHMIAATRMNGRWLFLDGTSSDLDYGLPSYAIQGKEALIMINKDSFVVSQVEEVSKETNNRLDSTFISIDQNVIRGRTIAQYNGLWKDAQLGGLRSLGEQKRLESLKSGFKKGNNKCKVDSISCSDLNARNIPLVFKAQFSITDYMKGSGKELYLNMHLDKDYQDDKIDLDKRKLDYEYQFKYSDEMVVVLNVPANLSVNLVPKDKNSQNESFGFEVKYTREKDRVLMYKKVYVNTMLLKKEQFKEWNTFIDALIAAEREVVILTKP